jgi:hypothetical protein
MRLYFFIFTIFICTHSLNAQYFTGGFSNNGNVLTLKIKPVGGNITSGISSFEFAIRYPSSVNIITSNLTPNTSGFPTLNIQQFPEFTAGSYKYRRFIHNTGTIPSATYTNGVEYSVFSIAVNGVGMSDIQLATDYNSLPPEEFFFQVTDGAGNPLFDIAGTDYFYPGQSSSGSIYYTTLLNIPLPVELLNISARPQDASITTQWDVQSEANLHSYDVERSIDGNNFVKIGSVLALNMNGYHSYSFKDYEVDSDVFYYYRLRVNEELNASGRYSNVVTAIIKGYSPKIWISPNPNCGNFVAKFSWPYSEQVDLLMVNSLGETVYSRTVYMEKGENSISLVLDQKLSGHLTLIAKSKISTVKTPIVITEN